MTEAKNGDLEFVEMTREFVREFAALKSDKAAFDQYLSRQYWTPHDGVSIMGLQDLPRTLKGLKPSAPALPYVVTDNDDLKMVIGTGGDRERLKEMADLLIFMQASRLRMIGNSPLYELLKAMTWYVNNLFIDAPKKISPKFDPQTANLALAHLPLEVDESFMPIACTQYMMGPSVISKLEILVERGADFKMYDGESFYRWLCNDDDSFLYAKIQIRKDLEGLKNSMRAAMLEKLRDAFATSVDPESAKRVDPRKVGQREDISGQLRGEMIRALGGNPKPARNVIVPKKIFQIGGSVGGGKKEDK